MLENVLSIINTVLLVIIFFYQKNKNKLLFEKIRIQEDIIKETKALVNTQYIAIEGQSKVVETALKYTDSLSVEKIESLIRREAKIEYKEKEQNISEKMTKQEKEIEDLKYSSDNYKRIAVSFFTSMLDMIRKVDLDTAVKLVETMKAGPARDIMYSIKDK